MNIFASTCRRALPLAVVLLGLAGCGHASHRAAVTGQVTLDGAPLAHGRIVFEPKGAGPAAAADITDGVFALNTQNGPGTGEFKVLIYGNREPPLAMDDPAAFTNSEFRKQPPVDPVAAEFNRATKLSAHVRAEGDNVFLFSVTSTPKLSAQGNTR